MLQRMGGSRAVRNGFDIQDTLSFESCSSSRVCDMEEAGSESSRKMRDKEDTTSWTAVRKWWRLEPEGEAEKLEVTVLRNEVDGVSVNPEGESHHEQTRTRANITRKEREDQAQNAAGEEGRGGSESTEEQLFGWTLRRRRIMCFVPSAISIPRGPMFWCDNRCSDTALRFWQFASVVVEEGEESHMANLCQQCYNKNLMAKAEAPLTNWQWKAVMEEKAHRGRQWRMLGKDQLQGMWEYFTLERLKAKRLMKEAEKERPEGIQGQRQHESRARNTLNK